MPSALEPSFEMSKGVPRPSAPMPKPPSPSETLTDPSVRVAGPNAPTDPSTRVSGIG